MQKATAVIGMNYGDEGKGHIVDYFSDENTLNIKFNGGAQASHAVFLSNGSSHIFHHFGSGSLRGARTLLSKHFIVNPLIFARELWELSEKVSMREIFIDSRCRVTTLYDMMINEFSAKYHKKTNTVGIGINETVERSAYRQLKISMRDFVEKTDDELTNILKRIENEYVPYRIKELKLPWDEFSIFSEKFSKEQFIENFLNIRSWMINRAIAIWPDDNLVDKFLAKSKERKLVFEGGQGMLLDQRRKEFMPYLTRSSTGLTNILELLKTVQTSIDLDVYLITRTYLTRHGDGPIWNHVPGTYPFPDIEETTNVDNPFQGAMRYGFLNLQWYNKALNETKDLLNKEHPVCINNSTINVAMTCCDHIGKFPFAFSKNGSEDIVKGDYLDFPNIKLLSFGPTEREIKEK